MGVSAPAPNSPHDSPRPDPLRDPAPEQAQSGGHTRLLLVIAGLLLLLSVPFGWSTWQAHQRFMEHRHLEDPSAFVWNQRALSVDECRLEVLKWAKQCSSIESWCKAAIPDLVRECLGTQDRRSYCAEVSEEAKSTRFGYQACREHYEGIEEKYEKRAAKKYCALSFRAIAGYCGQLSSSESPRPEPKAEAEEDGRSRL